MACTSAIAHLLPAPCLEALSGCWTSLRPCWGSTWGEVRSFAWSGMIQAQHFGLSFSRACLDVTALPAALVHHYGRSAAHAMGPALGPGLVLVLLRTCQQVIAAAIVFLLT